jgi:CarD family transcriptional regulator
MPQKALKKKTAIVKKSAVKTAAKKAPVKKAVAKTASVKKAVTKKPVAKLAPKKAVTKAPAAKAAVKSLPQKKAPMKAIKPVAVKAVVAVKPAAAPAPVKAPVAAVAAKPVVAAAPKASYKVGNHVVYPTHGVGRIMAEETQMIGDVELRMLVISFEKDKMTLRVPVHRATAAGLRPVSTADQMKKVFITLKSRARTSRGMWSRRAQEYEAKINSGNIQSIAEVVRDLHQNVDQSERSYSERMIYESALSRLVGELAAAEATDHKTATDKLMKLLRAKAAATPAVTKEAA